MDFILEYSLWLLLAVGTGFSFYWLMANRRALKLSWWMALVLSLAHTLVGVLSVKVFAVMETLDFSKAGSMSLFGGVFFMPLLYMAGAKLFKRRVGLVTDVFTPCMIFTVMCARVNCILSGCCQGALIPGTEGWRYPTRELEIVFYIVLLSYFLFWGRKPKAVGVKYPLYMGAYGAFRFACEFFRNSESASVFHISHLWAVIAFLVGIAVYTELCRPKTQKK